MAKYTFNCIDGHTCGNPVRIITSGKPNLIGDTIFEKRLHFMKEFDWIRKGLMFEPRGHDMMSGSIIYPPSDPVNDASVIFIETSGCLPMCGHGTIGMITIAIEQELIVPKEKGKVRLETPAGLVIVDYYQVDKEVKSVKLTNIASYLAAKDLNVQSSHLGKLTFDVSYGGNFYAIIDPQPNFLGIENYTADQLISFSREIRKEINRKYSFEHPENKLISGVTHIEWTGKTISPNSTARNVVFYGDKAIDRSPCGTGTSARMAQWFSKGKLKVGDQFIHESFIGSRFIGRVEKETRIGEYSAIIPSIEGWAKTTGFNKIIIDEDDPYAQGFQVI